MPHVTSDGARIRYDDTGSSSLPVLLLAHGMFMDRRMFDRQIDELSRVARIICWDARGHGDTTDQGKPFTYWQSAHDAIAVLDKLGIERAVIGGMSQGGFTALRLALAAPERVSGLVLIGTEAGRPTPGQVEQYSELFAAWLDNTMPLEPIATSLAPSLIGGDADRDQRVWIDRWLSQDRTLIAQAAKCIVDRESVTDRIAEISTPTLVIRGANDMSISSAAVHQMATALGSSVVEIAGAGHAVNWTHPTPVNEAIRDFIETLTARDELR
ncbi:alpha/beta hydrolase [Rhodococcus sp. SBT000017]|uniref:alpha/beta fold hydrolase n=1 Tax=Rhodococcus sp. SBT000017 TaxID=1803385 RepID=UPI000EF889A6|nr:alpha/beta hydrolase [Rhodococcus sp. SBT000017]RMB69768.1 alpha/beta hydrolase [Rhodococcus sp. SBT000017]